MDSLPDLDQGPEVFETSDVESVDNLGGQIDEAPDADIEQNLFNVNAAHNTFEENTLVGQVDLVDFSGSLSAQNLGQNTYYTRKWTETRSQRLARIQRELEDIQAEDDDEKASVETLRETLEASVASRGSNGYHHQKIRATFAQIETQLKDLDFSALAQCPPETQSHPKPLEKHPHPAEAPKVPGGSDLERGSILGLESRITDLEAAIGINELSPGANVRVHLRDLDRKVNVLYNPEHEMAAIKETVSQLNSEVEALAKNRRMAQLALPDNPRAPQGREPASPSASMASSVFEKKVDSVYQRLDEIDTIKARLPAVIARLRSLHEIHSDLAGAVTTVGEVDDMLSTLRRDLDTWNSNLNTVKTAFKVHAEAFEQRSQRIEAELQQMEARIDALL
ncbi:hypothetical protein JCM33374_g954 [Metschnikowia sp. JCM 33374]|nr:hypothetical protein JCM33374_g954 [Metschnikowia sp. JCM 33374]